MILQGNLEEPIILKFKVWKNEATEKILFLAGNQNLVPSF